MDITVLDEKLFFLINHGTSNNFFNILMPALSAKGYLLMVPYVGYQLWKGYKDKDGYLQKIFWAMGIAFFSFLLSDWIGQEMKNSIQRVRPCKVLEGVRLLAGCTTSGSMPSNHAFNSFAYAMSFFYFTKGHISVPWRLYPLLLASFVALSRVYVGVHYPTDIAAGALLGCGVSLALIYSHKVVITNYRIRPHETVLFIALMALSLFRIYYILHGPLDLSPDEAHYWEWSRRLDLSYYSKGPMIAYLIYLGTLLFGDTVFGIRVMAVIFSALSSIYLFKLGKLMYKEESVGLYSALLLPIIPLFGAFGIIFTIDSPFIFFWILSLFLFWKAITAEGLHGVEPDLPQLDGRLRAWMLLGLSMGLGLLTKYTMAFFYLCGFLFLVFSEKRSLLRTSRPYLAVLVSFLIFSPVIIWNMQHDWVTVRHTAGQAHLAEGVTLSLESFIEFIGSQVGVITPIFFGIMFFALIRFRTSKFSLQHKVLSYFSVPVIAFFIVKSLQGKVQANWAMPGYITGIMAIALFFVLTRSKTAEMIKWTGISMALAVTIVSYYPSLIRLPVKLDPTARLRGWTGLGTEVTKIYDSMSDNERVLIFSDSYQVASELAFYVKGHPTTFCINLGRRMNQYDLWPNMNATTTRMGQMWRSPLPSGINGIFVRADNTDMPQEVAESFDRFEKRVLRVYDKKNLLREYSLFICYNFKGFKERLPATY